VGLGEQAQILDVHAQRRFEIPLLEKVTSFRRRRTGDLSGRIGALHLYLAS
jgi:hypothetical protein